MTLKDVWQFIENVATSIETRIKAANISFEGNKGTGIELFITRKVIHKHGGSISVKSKEGGGAVFTVSLPRRSREIPD